MEVAPGRRRTSWAYGWLILATVAIACAPVAYSDYAYADDFWILTIRPLDAPTVSGSIHGFFNEGRPLFPLWALGVMGQIDAVRDLKFVRMLTLVALVLDGLVFYKLVNRHLIEDRLSATLTACFFAINPAFLIMAGWATIGCDAYASLFGLLSICVLLSDPLYDKQDAAARNSTAASTYGRLALSALGLLVSLCLYQPGAMLFWTGTAIWVIGRFTGSRADWLKLVRIGLVFGFVLGIYMALAHVLASAESRVHVSTAIVRRLGWFILFPLKNSLCYPSIQPRVAWSIVALLILSYGLWSWCRRNARTMWIPLLVMLLSPATVLPTIFAYGHYDVSRTRGALYGLIIVLWYVAFTAIGARLDSRTLRALAVALLVALAFFGQNQLQRYLIAPQVWEETALVRSLQDYARENPHLDRPVALWPPVAYPYPAQFQNSDEMGVTSLSRTVVPPLEIRQMLSEITHQKSGTLPGLTVVTLSGTDTPPPGAFVIDYRPLSPPP